MFGIVSFHSTFFFVFFLVFIWSPLTGFHFSQFINFVASYFFGNECVCAAVVVDDDDVDFVDVLNEC